MIQSGYYSPSNCTLPKVATVKLRADAAAQCAKGNGAL